MSDSEATPDPAEEVAPEKPKAEKKKANKKKKAPENHPKYSKMIEEGLTSLKERNGSSRQALLKYVMTNYDVGKDERVVNNHLKMSLRAGIKNGVLKQSKGTGASGSFKLGEKAAKKVKKSKPAKKAEPKAKKEAPPKAGKSPKKVKKPKAVKSKKPAKSAKKAKPAKKAKKAKGGKGKVSKGRKAKAEAAAE